MKEQLKEEQEEELRRERDRQRAATQRQERRAFWQGEGLLEEKELPFSKTTAWRLRNKGLLRSSKIGGKRFYFRDSVEELLQKGVELEVETLRLRSGLRESAGALGNLERDEHVCDQVSATA